MVVPESARRLASDSEGYVLFSVVILKKFERAVQAACRENRYAMRLFNLEEMKESSATELEERELAKFEVEEKKLKVAARAECDVVRPAAVVPAELLGAGQRVGAPEGAARVRGEHSAVRTAHAHVLLRRVRRGCGAPGQQPKAKTAEKLFATLDGLFAELGGSVKAYGSLKEENLTISAIVGNESTNYNYACVSIEKLSECRVCCIKEWGPAIARGGRGESERGTKVKRHSKIVKVSLAINVDI